MRSFDNDPAVVRTDAHGQKAHFATIEHTERLARKLYEVRPGVWSLIGNGLSNQTFILAPEGVIAIDTGESNEEMAEAIAELRTVTDAPLAAVLYTHFHYVGGTKGAFAEAGRDLPVYGHERIPFNLSRVTSEIAPAYSSGLVHQFAMRLPEDGPDGLVNDGLGLFFRNPTHAPFTPGFVPPTVTWRGGESLTIAGLRVEVTHAPSDADDSVTLWFPEIGTCVQNLVWPALFNIFAIRGEAYRDPQLLLTGIDHLLSLNPEHMVGAHGPPISGADEIRTRVTRYRDAIQLLWDQTVRGMNKGLSADLMAHSIRLPDAADDDYLTSELYGVAEHHVRQIASGVRGWFDGDTSKLFPLEPVERAGRMVEAFGGVAALRGKVQAARDANEVRWALELASWLTTRDGAEQEDRNLLAAVLRDVGYRTSAANIRNWCLTRARDLDGTQDLSRLREHRLRAPALEAMTAREALHLIRVLFDPIKGAGLDLHIGFSFPDASAAGLHIRNGVSVATDGVGAAATITLPYDLLVQILAGQARLGAVAEQGQASIAGDQDAVLAALGCFEVPGFAG
jgi:alkyl sulfatase BDS1-like metallo-beta-lactamase superfamily hydrolase